MRRSITCSVLESNGYRGERKVDKKTAQLEEIRIFYLNSVQEVGREIEQAERHAERIKEEINNEQIALEK
jgi:hypothetical protein